MQVPILTGIYTDAGPDVRTALPVNMVPVVAESGVSQGYLRPGDGLVVNGSLTSGNARGGINWNGVLYRVNGTELSSVDASGNDTLIGDVGAGGPVSLTFGIVDDSTPFTDGGLAIASGGRLYLYDGSTMTQVTDVNLGVCLDVIWIDGYFVSTDGEFFVCTELTDPFSVLPFNYAAADAFPDGIVALERVRDQVCVIGRFTIEHFQNVGGSGFPFQRINGAQIMKGAVGTHAVVVVEDTLCFTGSGVNESIGVYFGDGGRATKISSLEVDRILASFTEVQLADTVMETRHVDGHRWVYVHLPDRSLVYDVTASQSFGTPVWFVLTTSTSGYAQYRGRFFVYAYDEWTYADPGSSAIGVVDTSISNHEGDDVRWEFSTPMIYNESKGAVIHDLELVALTGRVGVDVGTPLISTSYSIDGGMTWSLDKSINAGSIGDRRRRLRWFQQGSFRNTRIQRFRGDSTAHLSFLRLEAAVSPLAW